MKKILFSLLIFLALSSCTQSVAEPPPATVTPTLSLALPAQQNGTPQSDGVTAAAPFVTFTPGAQTIPGSGSNTYTVIWVLAEDVLNIRLGPGVENPVIGELQPNQSGLIRTGKIASVGDEQWVEIQNPEGGNGWVNAEFLAEYAAPSTFCADTLVTSLLHNLEVAVSTSDGELLKSLVSPAHGLDVIYLRSGMVANYSAEEAGWAFQSTYPVDWGAGSGSGEPVIGTFPDIVLPALQDTFKNMTLICNEVKLGGASYLAEWPKEFANINFYSLHNPGNDPTLGGLDWHTWLVGVEYVDGKPYLFSLMHYQWEP
jgi:hypothetical protein